MIYNTHLIISGESRRNIKIIVMLISKRSKCNSHNLKLQYLSGSEKKQTNPKVFSDHHSYKFYHVISHSTIRGKNAYGKIDSEVSETSRLSFSVQF